MNITFLIGNGFDRNLGLDTNYSDFIKVYKKSDVNTQILKDFRTFIDENQELWSSAELAFGIYTREFASGKGAQFSECQDDFCQCLANYLKEQELRIDYLANIMIANSDNSATNMLLYEIGGMDGFNRAMRNLGLKVTSMGGWLPDIEGYNKTTAREMSTLLYNIDNPNYINIKQKNVLKEYLGNTKNIHLLKEKLPQSAMVLHKTGNIGTMLGDSGIVYTDNGKKYIVTILVKRPFNDYSAKTLIQDASLLIYNDVKSL